jgi:drug/metabolite transporter (DMT)-like permease
MPKWLFYSLVSVVTWAFWAIIPKATSNKMSPVVMQVLSTIGLLPVASTLVFRKTLTAGRRLGWGMGYAFVTGLCGCLGNVAVLVALRHGGEASTIYPLTGMYPLVTVVLAGLVLKERPNGAQWLGIALALVALYLFSASGTPQAATAGCASGCAFSLWLILGVVALILYGIAGITQKFATNEISTELSTICFSAAFGLLAVALAATQSLSFQIEMKDWLLAILFGALMGFAMLSQFAAYRAGKASIITAVTALYPALTIALAVPLFREGLDGWKITAIVMSLGAGIALSYEGEAREASSHSVTGAVESKGTASD